MDQRNAFSIIDELQQLQLSRNTRFVVSIGSACHPGHLELCLYQLLSQKTVHNVFPTREQIPLQNTLVVIDQGFNSFNQERLLQHLSDDLGIAEINAQTNTTGDFPVYTFSTPTRNLRIVCFQCNMPIYFPEGLQALNDNIPKTRFQQFYLDFYVFSKAITDLGGSFLILNFVKFIRAPRGSIEWWVDRLLQKYLCHQFPTRPLFHKYLGSRDTHSVNSLLLSWVGYSESFPEFQWCLYEPLDGFDRGLDPSIGTDGQRNYTQSRIFIPYNNSFNPSKAIQQLSEHSWFNRFTDSEDITGNKYVFMDLYIGRGTSGWKLSSLTDQEAR